MPSYRPYMAKPGWYQAGGSVRSAAAGRLAVQFGDGVRHLSD
jgi:hypothetical protein